MPDNTREKLRNSLKLEIFSKCEKPLEYVTKLVIADTEDSELRGMGVREYDPDFIKTRYSEAMANQLLPFIQSEITKAEERGVQSAARYWESKYNTRVGWLEAELLKITGKKYSDNSQTLGAHITKAQEQLLDELEAKSEKREVGYTGEFTETVIPLSAIEAKREEIRKVQS